MSPASVKTTRRLAIPAVLVAAVLALFSGLFFGAAPSARADTSDQVIAGLRSQPLYVSHDAPNALSASGEKAVLNALDDADSTIRIVVVQPSFMSSKRSAAAHLQQLDMALGKKGTIAAVSTNGTSSTMIAGSHELDKSKINTIIAQSHGSGGLKERLVTFTKKVDKAVQDQKASSAMVGYIIVGVIILIAIAIVSVVLVARKRRNERKAREMAELKESVYEDVTQLGEDVTRLNLNVTDPNLDPATRDDYGHAMDSYDQAKAAVEKAERPEDMRQVTTALEDGRYYMMAVRARLDGRPVPERRAPCFFNPQHGPSVQDVTWAPMGGMPREVPACAADAQRVLSGMDPESRMVSVGGSRRPYWDAGPAYAPYAGGYYSGFGGDGMLGGLLMGTMLGSMMGGFGGGFGGGWGDGGFGGGDFGGGDSGFDIGGGDFGGGDFGDFGGF